FILKWFISCVFPGLPEVLANPFLWVSILIRDDFPTLDLPIKAYSGRGSFGQLATLELLITKSADFIFICRCLLFFLRSIKFDSRYAGIIYRIGNLQLCQR